MAFTTAFIASQIVVFIALITDFIGMQLQKRKQMYFFFLVSALLIAVHFFLLDKMTAGIIVIFSAVRFLVCMFTASKKYLWIFLAINTLVLLFTFSEILDFMIYAASVAFLIGNFQKDPTLMRKIMMVGTTTAVAYNAVIFSPMGALLEGTFLISSIIGYYRHYIKRNDKKEQPISEL